MKTENVKMKPITKSDIKTKRLGNETAGFPNPPNAQTAVSALSSIRSLALADNQRNGGRLLF